MSTKLPTDISALISQFLPDSNWYTLETELRRILTTKHLLVDDGPRVTLYFNNEDTEIEIHLDREVLLVPGSFRRCRSIHVWCLGEVAISAIDHDQEVDNYIASICHMLVRALGPTVDVSDWAYARWPSKAQVEMCLNEIEIPAVWATGYTPCTPQPPTLTLPQAAPEVRAFEDFLPYVMDALRNARRESDEEEKGDIESSPFTEF